MILLLLENSIWPMVLGWKKKTSVRRVFGYKHKGQSLYIFTFLNWFFCQLAKKSANYLFLSVILKRLNFTHDRVVFWGKKKILKTSSPLSHIQLEKQQNSFPDVCAGERKLLKVAHQTCPPGPAFTCLGFILENKKKEGREWFEMNHVKTKRQWQISLNSNISAAESL